MQEILIPLIVAGTAPAVLTILGSYALLEKWVLWGLSMWGIAGYLLLNFTFNAVTQGETNVTLAALVGFTVATALTVLLVEPLPSTKETGAEVETQEQDYEDINTPQL